MLEGNSAPVAVVKLDVDEVPPLVRAPPAPRALLAPAHRARVEAAKLLAPVGTDSRTLRQLGRLSRADDKNLNKIR